MMKATSIAQSVRFISRLINRAVFAVVGLSGSKVAVMLSSDVTSVISECPLAVFLKFPEYATHAAFLKTKKMKVESLVL